MRFFIKLTAVAMSAAIVFGCGATLNASETRYNIDEYFTDPAFNQLIRKYDSNRDGYLTDTEVLNGTGNGNYLDIYDLHIKKLDGIEVLPALNRLKIETGAAKVDLSSCKSNNVRVTGNEFLKTVVCGKSQKELEISHCNNLKKAYFNYANNLGCLHIWNCCTLTGNLNLENSPKLYEIEVYDTKIQDICCSDNASLHYISVQKTPLRNLEIRGTGFDGIDPIGSIEINTDKTLTNITAKADLARFLWEHGLFKNNYCFSEEHGTFIHINNTGHPIEFNGRIFG